LRIAPTATVRPQPPHPGNHAASIPLGGGGLLPPYSSVAIDFAGMDRMLDQLTPEEIGALLRMIAALERWGTRPAEADEWRLRILARQWFLELDGTVAADA